MFNKPGGRLAERAWNSPVLTTFGSLFVRLLGLAVLLPLALYFLPVEEANLWFLFSSVLAIQGLIDFGFSPTFTRIVAYSRAAGQAPAERPAGIPDLGSTDLASAALIASMRLTYHRLGMLALLLLATVGSLAVARPIALIDTPAVGWLAWLVIAVTGTIGFRGGMYSTYLLGVEKIALLRRWEIVVGLATTTAGCLALLAGAGLLGIVLAVQTGTVVNAWVNRTLAVRISSRDEWSGRAVSSRKIMDAVWPAAWRSGIGVLVGAGIVQATGVLYAQMATAAESASYLLALRLVNMLRQFSNVPFYTRLPQMAKTYADGQVKRLIEIAGTAMLRVNWLLTAGVLVIALVGDDLLSLVHSNTPFVTADVWGMLGLAMLCERIGAMHLQLYSTTNHVVWHIAAAVSGIIMLVAIPVAYKWFGLLGFPMGIFAGYVVFYIPYCTRLSYRAFNLKIRDFDLTASVMPLLILIALEVILLDFDMWY